MTDGIKFNKDTFLQNRGHFFDNVKNQEEYQNVFDHLIENEEWLGDENNNTNTDRNVGSIDNWELANFISHIDVGPNGEGGDGIITDDEIVAWAESNNSQFHKDILDRNKNAFSEFKNFLNAMTGNKDNAKVASNNSGVLGDPKVSATVLHDAMEGAGTKEDTLKAIIENASEDELKEIVKQYDEMYSKDGKNGLIERIASETSGKFEKEMIDKVITSLLSDPEDKEASASLVNGLHKAMEGAGTNENILKSIINNADEAQLKEIAKQYDEAYAKDNGKNGLIERIASETSGELEKTLVDKVVTSLLSDPQDETASQMLADGLYQAMKGVGTNENILKSVINNADESQIRDIAAKYNKSYGKGDKDTLIQRIQDETSGKFETEMIDKVVTSLLADCEENPDSAAALAKELETAMKGWGTDEKMLKAILSHKNMTEEKYQALIDAYRELTGDELYKVVRSEGERDILDNLEDKFKYGK